MANAPVFPEPVRARISTSFPSNRMGIALSWMGVGSSHPSLATA